MSPERPFADQAALRTARANTSAARVPSSVPSAVRPEAPVPSANTVSPSCAVIGETARARPVAPEGYSVEAERSYGKARITLLRAV